MPGSAYRMVNIPSSVAFQGPRAGMDEVICAVGVRWIRSHAFLLSVSALPAGADSRSASPAGELAPVLGAVQYRREEHEHD